MKSKTPQLNKTTRLLKSLFPALLLVTPLMASAETTISGSTDSPQIFSSDSAYIILEGVMLPTY